jgi:hypothetical protein
MARVSALGLAGTPTASSAAAAAAVSALSPGLLSSPGFFQVYYRTLVLLSSMAHTLQHLTQVASGSQP